MGVANSRFAVASAIAKIAEITYPPGNVNANADFPAIPQTFRHLLIVYKAGGSGNGQLGITFNGDGTLSYDTQLLQGAGAAAAAAETLGTGAGSAGELAGAATEGAGGFVLIPFYADATLRKQSLSHVGYSQGNLTGQTQARHDTTHWRNVAAINRVTLAPPGGAWRAGSIISLYGLA